ncbi:MAG: hypothetical protein ABI480_12170 [Chitinophagaceae bacterium]
MKSSKPWVILTVLAVTGMTTYFIILKKQQDNNLRAIRNSWTSWIFINNAHYTYTAFGSAEPLDIPIQNNSDYIIDEVIVAIRYGKSSGVTVKTENVTINNILPHSIKTAHAPATLQGVSVDTDITEVVSRGLQFCYPSGSGSVGDPYYCQ